MSGARFAEFYDRIYAGKDYAGEARMVFDQLEALAGRKPTRLLDAGCGTGTHALHLARLGTDVTGIDIDEASIAVARRKAAGTSGLSFVAGRVEDMDRRPFDAAVSLFNVVNYFVEAKALISFLEAIALRLEPGAPFVFDSWNGLAALFDPPREKRVTEGKLCSVTIPHLDLWTQTVLLEQTIECEGERFSYAYRHRLWTPAELQDALTTAGFGIHEVFPWGAPGMPATPETWKLTFACRRMP